MLKSHIAKRLGMFAAAAALSAMMVPGIAMADEPANSTTGPDNVVTVNWSRIT